jgi:hypothetical protein
MSDPRSQRTWTGRSALASASAKTSPEARRSSYDYPLEGSGSSRSWPRRALPIHQLFYKCQTRPRPDLANSPGGQRATRVGGNLLNRDTEVGAVWSGGGDEAVMDPTNAYPTP